MSGELVSRFTDDAQRLGQLEKCALFGFTLFKNVTIWLSYVHVVTYAKTGANGVEDQSMEQVTWDMGKIFGAALFSRSRFALRF